MEQNNKDIIVDFDDFSEKNHRLDLLTKLKAAIPGFRVTLFTVLGQCTKEFLQEVAKREWIELAVHGYEHSFKECLHWDREKTVKVLSRAEAMGTFVKGFKAPYWAITPVVYEVLKERGYWVADQAYNDNIRPAGLLAYKLPGSFSENRVQNVQGIGKKNELIVHGHIGNVCSNGIEEQFEYYKGLRGRFHFINFWIRKGG